MKQKTKQCLKTKGLIKGGNILAYILFKYLPLFLCSFALIVKARVMINIYFNQNTQSFTGSLCLSLLLPPSSTCFLHLPLGACFA